jgi:AcrR family transcriptional regulator
MAPPVNAHVAASQQTRHELLEAGLRLLTSQPASTAFGHLTANKIATEAGRTSGAFFHQWPTLEAYIQDFIGYVLRPELAVNLQTTVARLAESMAEGNTFNQALTSAGRSVPEQTANDPQTVIELLMWNRSLHDDDFRTTVAPHYKTLDAGAGTTFVDLMTLLGREPRHPFTAKSMAAVCTAIAQGLSLRASLTPDLYPDEIFGWIVATIVPLLTRGPDDQRDANQYVEDLPLQLEPRGSS